MTKRRPNCFCRVCGEGFYCPPSRQSIGHGKYCSKRCMGEAKKGSKCPGLTYQFPKGNIPWNKGRGRRDAMCGWCQKNISVLDSQGGSGVRFCSRDCAYAAARKPDDELGYQRIHARIRERYGTPNRCEHCGTDESKKFEWANISGKYLLVREDWARLCCRCHRRYDFGTKNKIEVLSASTQEVIE